MYPIIDSVTFVTHDRRHVSVSLEDMHVRCSWPLCDDREDIVFKLSEPTHLDYDEEHLRRLGGMIRTRCLPEEARAMGMSDDVHAYFQILRRLIPCCD